MSHPRSPVPVKAFASLIYSSREDGERALGMLEEKVGEMDVISEVFPFNHTSYYEEEMGSNLVRRFVAFKDLILPDLLPSIKHKAFSIEKALSTEDRRKVNIDPGYMACEKVVLSTFKNFSHRLYMGDSVYLDLVLIYRNKGFSPLEWTFPDYRDIRTRRFFHSLRGRYLFQLKEVSHG